MIEDIEGYFEIDALRVASTSQGPHVGSLWRSYTSRDRAFYV